MIERAQERWKTLRRVLLLAVALVTVAQTYVAGEQLGMKTTLSTRHVFYSLPYAVSHWYFGTSGYVILRDVAEVFISTHPNVTNDTIAEAIALKPSPDRLMYFPGDDKGYADFALLSFKAFGLRIESLYYLWFSLYLLSILVFVAVFWQLEMRLATVALATLAIYTACFALPLTFELLSVHNPRAFGAISLIAMLHLMFTMIDGQRLTFPRLLAVLLQSALIALSIDVRSTEWWQVLALAGVVAWLVVRRRPAIAMLWPCAVLAIALVGLDIYQRQAVAPVYEQTQLRHRIFWHNVGIGFALNPALAHKYSLFIDDGPMTLLVKKRLRETNRADQVDLVFNPEAMKETNYWGFATDYVQYERVARDVVLSIIWNNKIDALHTFVVDKPILLAKQLAWAAGYKGYSIDELQIAGQIGMLIKEDERPRRSIYLTPFRTWTVIGLVVIGLVAGSTARRDDWRMLAASTLWVFAVSLLPSMAAYPIISSIGVVLVTAPFAAFAILLWLPFAVTSLPKSFVSAAKQRFLELRPPAPL